MQTAQGEGKSEEAGEWERVGGWADAHVRACGRARARVYARGGGQRVPLSPKKLAPASPSACTITAHNAGSVQGARFGAGGDGLGGGGGGGGGSASAVSSDEQSTIVNGGPSEPALWGPQPWQTPVAWAWAWIGAPDSSRPPQQSSAALNRFSTMPATAVPTKATEASSRSASEAESRRGTAVMKRKKERQIKHVAFVAAPSTCARAIP